MKIDNRTLAMGTGAAFGAYSSDITENPLLGIINTGIGAGIGAMLDMPSVSFTDMSKVNAGPQIDLARIQELNTKSTLDITEQLDNFYNRTRTPLNDRIRSLQQKKDIKLPLTSPDVIQRQMKAYASLERNNNNRINSINNKYNSIIERRSTFNSDLMEFKRGNAEVIFKNKEIELYNRAVIREERAIEKYLGTSKGKKELDKYDKWIERESKKRGLTDRPLSELRNDLFNTYTKDGKNFQKVIQIKDHYSKRYHADKKDLFKPWFKDFKAQVNESIDDFEKRSNDLFEKFKLDTYADRDASLVRQQKAYEERKASIDNWVAESQSVNHQARHEARIDAKIQKKEAKFNKEQAVYNNLQKVLKSNGINVSNNREEIINVLKSTTNENVLNQANLILRNNEVNFINQSQLNVKQWNSTRQSTNTLDGAVSYLEKVLGNNATDAEAKAKLFLNRAVKGELSFQDGVVSFVDKVNNERVTLPLTSYTSDGTRYHNMGKGNYSIAHQYNPYASALTKGLDVDIDGVKRKVTAKDVIKGYDPETMIKHLPDNAPISSIMSNIQGLFHYNSRESGVRFNDLNSETFKNSQGIVNLNTNLRFNEYGDVDQTFPFKKLGQSSSKDMASERQIALFKLAQELDPSISNNLTAGLSLGDLTNINTKGFESFALFAPNERGETSVGNRGTEIVNKNSYTQALEGLLGAEDFNKQFSSSQVLSRLDIKDDKLFNEIATSLFGNDVVLGDGAGFYNMVDGDSLSIRDKSTIKIPLSNNMAIANQDLLVGLTSEEGLTEYLKNNPINIDNNPLAYKENGSTIGLNKAYSRGTIIDGFVTKDEIRLVTDSYFDANNEQNVKFYSTGTKSLNTGLEGGRFNLLTSLGLALNSGEATLNKDILNFKGQKFNINDRNSILSALAIDFESNGYKAPTLISRASDTGASRILEIIDGDVKDNKIYNLLMSRGSDSRTAGMTAALFSENKANVDLKTTLAISIEDKIKKGLLSESFRKDFLYNFNLTNYNKAKDKVGFLQKANNLVAASGMVDAYLEGNSYTIGSLNKGASIVGKGNRAKMSWAAMGNLKSSGLTKEDLSVFGTKDDKTLYELRSISEERRVSNNSINKFVQGKEARFLNIISNSKAEDRSELLSSAFKSGTTLESNPFISYNLVYDDHSVKSINFSKVTTNRSGLQEDFDFKLLKDLESKKLDIFVADLEYKESATTEERVKTAANVKQKLDEYDAFVKKMMSGDNNLLKEGVSLYSDKSSIMEIKYIGGNADKYATQEMKKNKNHVWFISEEEAKAKANQLGVTLDWEKVDGFDNIKKPIFKRGDDVIPLASLITREPAQGPLSSDLVTFAVDETISKKSLNNAYVPISNKIYYEGMFGDGDQDTVQTLLGDFQNRSQYDSIEGKRKNIRASFFDMQDVIASMKIKGNKNKMKTLADFDSPEEYAQYRMSGALKGRNRKQLAAPATGLAVAYAKAFEMNLGGAGDSKELTQGRVMIHQLVENLLKSAHLDTDSFQLVNEQDVERLSRMRNGFLGKSGYEGVTLNQYKQELEKTLPSFLGINNINTDTIKGKDTKNKATNILNTIIDAELKQAQTVGDLSFTPLDINQHRFSKDSMDFIDSMNSIIKESGVTDVELESGLRNIRKSSGQVALGAMDYLTDVWKNNKLLIGGGLAAMAGASLLGRDQPNFSDSRSAARQHSSAMLRSPNNSEETSMNNTPTPMGINTNTQQTGFVMPKLFGTKNVQITGQTYNNLSDMYTEYNSLLDSENIEQQFHSMSSALFGDGIRSARLQNN